MKSALRYTWSVILCRAAEVCLSTFGVMMLGALLLVRIRRKRDRRAGVCLGIAACTAFAFGLIPLFVLKPNTGALASPLRSDRAIVRLVEALNQRYRSAVRVPHGALGTQPEPPSLDEVRAFARDFLASADAAPYEAVDPALALREEDSPGNYTVVDGGDGWPGLRVYWADGAAEVVWPR